MSLCAYIQARILFDLNINKFLAVCRCKKKKTAGLQFFKRAGKLKNASNNKNNSSRCRRRSKWQGPRPALGPFGSLQHFNFQGKCPVRRYERKNVPDPRGRGGVWAAASGMGEFSVPQSHQDVSQSVRKLISVCHSSHGCPRAPAQECEPGIKDLSLKWLDGNRTYMSVPRECARVCVCENYISI